MLKQWRQMIQKVVTNITTIAAFRKLSAHDLEKLLVAPKFGPLCVKEFLMYLSMAYDNIDFVDFCPCAGGAEDGAQQV